MGRCQDWETQTEVVLSRFRRGTINRPGVFYVPEPSCFCGTISGTRLASSQRTLSGTSVKMHGVSTACLKAFRLLKTRACIAQPGTQSSVPDGGLSTAT